MLLRCSVGGWGASGVCPTTSAPHCVLPFSCSTSPESWKNSFSIASMLAPPRLFINYSFHFINFSAFHNFGYIVIPACSLISDLLALCAHYRQWMRFHSVLLFFTYESLHMLTILSMNEDAIKAVVMPLSAFY